MADQRKLWQKRWFGKHEYDVKLWRHKQPTPNTNDTTRRWINPLWKFSAYATVSRYRKNMLNPSLVVRSASLYQASTLWSLEARIFGYDCNLERGKIISLQKRISAIWGASAQTIDAIPET